MLEITSVNGNILSYSSIVISFLLVSLFVPSIFKIFIKFYNKKIQQIGKEFANEFNNATKIKKGEVEILKDRYLTLDALAKSITQSMEEKIKSTTEPKFPQIWSFLLAIVGSQMSFYDFLTTNNFQNIFIFSVVLSVILTIITIWQYKDLYTIYFKDNDTKKEGKKWLHRIISIFCLIVFGAIFYSEYKYAKQLFFLNIVGLYLLTNVFVICGLRFYSPTIKDLSNFLKNIKKANDRLKTA